MKAPRGLDVLLATWLALVVACRRDPHPVAPGEPIPAEPEVALGTMDAECEGLLAALATFKQCPNLEDDDKGNLEAWGHRAEQDFAAGKKAKPDADAQHAIAAACHKATVSVMAATERCQAGPRPPR